VAVNAGPEFTRHPEVISGASDLLVEIFADKGRHTRFAVGASSRPMNASVEVVAAFQIVTSNHPTSPDDRAATALAQSRSFMLTQRT